MFGDFPMACYVEALFPTIFIANIAMSTLLTTNIQKMRDFALKYQSSKLWEEDAKNNFKNPDNIATSEKPLRVQLVTLLLVLLFIVSDLILTIPVVLHITFLPMLEDVQLFNVTILASIIFLISLFISFLLGFHIILNGVFAGYGSTSLDNMNDLERHIAELTKSP